MAVSPSSPTQRTSLQWHVGLVHNQGTQQPAPLISGECSLVPFEPYSVHLQPQTRPTGHHWPLGTTHEHAYGHTHTGAQHSATAVIVTVSMNDHRLICSALCTVQKGSLQPSSPAHWHHQAYRKPGQPLVKIHYGTASPALHNPKQSKMVRHGHGSGEGESRQEDGAAADRHWQTRKGCWNAINSSLAFEKLSTNSTKNSFSACLQVQSLKCSACSEDACCHCSLTRKQQASLNHCCTG